MNGIRDDHYSRAQIVLHWAIVALVIVQLVSHEGMEQAFGRLMDDPSAGFGWTGMVLVHAISGATVLVLMAVRIMLRVRLGAPALPPDMPAWQRKAANASHFSLYALLVALPLTGAVAVLFGNGAAGGLHSLLVTLLWIVIAAHVAGALYHAFVRRDGVIWRIMVPRP